MYLRPTCTAIVDKMRARMTHKEDDNIHVTIYPDCLAPDSLAVASMSTPYHESDTPLINVAPGSAQTQADTRRIIPACTAMQSCLLPSISNHTTTSPIWLKSLGDLSTRSEYSCEDAGK